MDLNLLGNNTWNLSIACGQALRGVKSRFLATCSPTLGESLAIDGAKLIGGANVSPVDTNLMRETM